MAAEIAKLQKDKTILEGMVQLEQNEKKLIEVSLKENMDLTTEVSRKLKELTKSIQNLEGENFTEKVKLEATITNLKEEITQWQDYR